MYNFKDLAIQDCLAIAKADENKAAAEWLDCQNQATERELRIAASAVDQLQKLAKRTTAILICALLGVTAVFGQSTPKHFTRFEALSQIESGDNDKAIGKSGEVSRYQMLPSVWRSMTNQNVLITTLDGKPLFNYRNASPTNEFQARQIVEDIMAHRESAQFWSHGKMATDMEWYLLWHRPARVNHPTARERERAQRFANLVQREPQ